MIRLLIRLSKVDYGFGNQVTLFEDGIYRWSYSMDMWRNRYLFKLIAKIISLLLGIPTLFLMVMVLKQLISLKGRGLDTEELWFFLRDDVLLLLIVGGIWIGSLLLTLLIYAISAAVMHGTWRL